MDWELDKLLQGYLMIIGEKADEALLLRAISLLCEVMEIHFGSKVVFL